MHRLRGGAERLAGPAGRAGCQRIRHYVLDGSDRDLRRLLSLAEVQAESARTAIGRIGDIAGWRAIECGCGPLGCLAVLSDLVGLGGTVVGVDFSEATVERARSVVAVLGIGNVEVVAGDVHEFDVANVGGPFDLGYTRAFLMHQADPERTLRKIAGMLRPGGWLLVQEPLRTPPPQSYPPAGVIGRYWGLMHEAAARSGVAPDAVENLRVSAARAGFEVAGARGFFNVMEPPVGFDIHASAVAALKSRLVGTGVATGPEVDELELSLRQAASTDGWLTSPSWSTWPCARGNRRRALTGTYATPRPGPSPPLTRGLARLVST